MFEKEKTEIDLLYKESQKEINDSEKLEFYLYSKLDKIIDLLSQNEQLTIEYLSSAPQDFFTFIFTENTDTAETILERLQSKSVAKLIIELCNRYRTPDAGFQFSIEQANKFLKE
jgi:hypothetical protein